MTRIGADNLVTLGGSKTQFVVLVADVEIQNLVRGEGLG